jgi:hypothetical protein
MNTIFFGKDGNIYITDKITGEKTRIYTIKYYLDCPVKIEEGTTFKQFFQHIIDEVDFIDVVYRETMGDTELSSFVNEWNNGVTTDYLSEIYQLRLRKTLQNIPYERDKNFVDVRIDFDGVGKNSSDIFSLEFMSLNDLKTYEIVLEDTIHIVNEITDNEGEFIIKKGNCVSTLFEIIGTILYEVTFYGDPQRREKSKQMLIDTVSSNNILSILEKQLEDATKKEDYEECRKITNMINKMKGLN